MENTDIRILVESQDELILVCQAAFDVIFENKLSKQLDEALVKYNVEPGFVERAENIRQRVSPEYRRIIALSGLTVESHVAN